MRAFFLGGFHGGKLILSWTPHGNKTSTCRAQELFQGRGRPASCLAVVLILLIWLPAYRWFFLISVGIGLVVAAILYFWHKFKPVREEDIEPKRPLGL